MKPWLQKNRERLRRRWQRWQDNRRLTATAARVRSAAPPPTPAARPVIFFNASTRLEGLSLNAAFSLVSSWAVQFAGAPVIHFVCRQGLSRCVLGTRRDDPLALPPCGDGWEKQMTEYPNVVEEHGRLRLFYCGNGYGATGIGTALADPLE